MIKGFLGQNKLLLNPVLLDLILLTENFGVFEYIGYIFLPFLMVGEDSDGLFFLILNLV